MMINTDKGLKYSAIDGKILDEWMYHSEFVGLSKEKILRDTAIMNIVSLRSISKIFLNHCPSTHSKMSDNFEGQARGLQVFFKITDKEIDTWKETYKSLIRKEEV